jgi:hypothetical protein
MRHSIARAHLGPRPVAVLSDVLSRASAAVDEIIGPRG